MNTDFELQDWVFDIQEKSSGVYEISGKHVLGPSLSLTGTDIDELTRRAHETACALSDAIKKMVQFRSNRPNPQ